MASEDRDCIYPDCLVRTTFGCACEHSCPFEDDREEASAVEVSACGAASPVECRAPNCDC